eukprot:1429605-Amphidinium_carterae.2
MGTGKHSKDRRRRRDSSSESPQAYRGVILTPASPPPLSPSRGSKSKSNHDKKKRDQAKRERSLTPESSRPDTKRRSTREEQKVKRERGPAHQRAADPPPGAAPQVKNRR